MVNWHHVRTVEGRWRVLRFLLSVLLVLVAFLAGLVLSTVRVINILPLALGAAFILRDRRWPVQLLGWILVLAATGFTVLWAWVYNIPGGRTW